MRLLYFAWVRQRVGLGQEDVTPPPDVANVGDLIAWLKKRGPAYQAAFGDERILRAAVDQVHADLDTPIGGAVEVAFFPPVTGG